MIKCDNCEKELDRRVFCDSKCRLSFFRKKSGEDETNRFGEEEKEVSETNRIKPIKKPKESGGPFCKRHNRVDCWVCT